jgi:hypothetical protein
MRTERGEGREKRRRHQSGAEYRRGWEMNCESKRDLL